MHFAWQRSRVVRVVRDVVCVFCRLRWRRVTKIKSCLFVYRTSVINYRRISFLPDRLCVWRRSLQETTLSNNTTSSSSTALSPSNKPTNQAQQRVAALIADHSTQHTLRSRAYLDNGVDLCDNNNNNNTTWQVNKSVFSAPQKLDKPL